MRRPASFAEVRSLDETHAWINRCGKDGGHVRRWEHPGQTGVTPPHRALPSAHRHDGQIAIQIESLVEVAGELARGHAVPRGKRKHADKARILLFANVPFEMNPDDRVGA